MCRHNSGVTCGLSYCERGCGWRPEVIEERKRRIAKMRDRRAEEIRRICEGSEAIDEGAKD